MTDAIKEKELRRYHIGEIVSIGGDTCTIQPQGEPIASPDGWWYPVDEVDQVISTLTKENERLREKYNELLFSVESKFPNETRHQTALRYIQQAERRCNGPALNQKEG